MKKELCEQLYLDYPNLFRNKVGIDCGDGWYTIIDSLSALLEQWIIEMDPGLGKQIYAEQVKEKYGGLRFYLSHETAMIDCAIALAEDLSLRTCENCGHPGTTRNGGWIKTLCNACDNEE